MFIPRMAHAQILEALKFFPVILLTGSRQVGKSTLALKLTQISNYVTLDNLTVYSGAKEDPVSFIEKIPKPVIIDEIQKLPNLILSIKEYVDKDRKNGQFLLTGSANLLAFKTISDTLAGRMAIIDLWPLSIQEKYQSKKGILDFVLQSPEELSHSNVQPEITESQIYECMITGGFPEILKINSLRGRYLWFSSYIRTYIERDVRDIASIRNIDGFIKVFRLFASRSANELNKNNIANEAQVDQKSLANYIEILKHTYQIYTLQNYSPNFTKRQIKSPKIFFTDTGILCHVLDIENAEILEQHRAKGSIFETFVFSEILKHSSCIDKNIQIFFHRSPNKREIDFILIHDGKMTAIEIKSSKTVNKGDFKHINAIQDKCTKEKFNAGYVIYLGEHIVPFSDVTLAIPIQSIL
jgi:hypothetical protein